MITRQVALIMSLTIKQDAAKRYKRRMLKKFKNPSRKRQPTQGRILYRVAFTIIIINTTLRRNNVDGKDENAYPRRCIEQSGRFSVLFYLTARRGVYCIIFNKIPYFAALCLATLFLFHGGETRFNDHSRNIFLHSARTHVGVARSQFSSYAE